MSNLGRLFNRIGTTLQTPIENFTTEALAIAIEHDDEPIRRALKKIAWPSAVQFDAERVTHVEARTQRYLPEADRCREGYLDLVLVLTLTGGEEMEAWVEVKVDSPESDGQLDVYADHARQRERRPAIFTLSKSEVRVADRHPKDFEIGWLSWKDLAASIETQGVVPAWTDFLQFLREHHLAWSPLPPTVVDPEAYLPVLIAVNNQIRERWPDYSLAWSGIDSSALKRAAREEYTLRNRIVVSGGPITYGLVSSGTGWAWSMTVGCTNYEHVRLDPGAILHRADRGGLSDPWCRLGMRHAVLEARLGLTECGAYEHATTWFYERLAELDDKGILIDYLAGVDGKRSASRVPL